MQAFSWLPSRMLLVMSLMVNAWSVERAAELAHGADSLQEVIFEPTVARYVRLVVYSEAAGDGTQLGVADLQLLGSAQGKPLPRGRWKVLDARGMSAEDAGPSMAIDTDVTTIWRARGEPPHYLDLDLGESASLSGFRYLPASDGVGVIHEYSVFVSDDAIDWGDPIMRGELAQRSEGVDKETSAGAPERLELVRQDFATEGMVYGPVAIDVDARNRVYVAETYRYNGRGVIDNRGKQRREEDDLQTDRLSDRRGFLSSWLADGELGSVEPDFFTKYSEKLSLLEDVDGDGRADRRTIVAEGFNEMLDGAAAGVLVRDSDVYFACVPAVWKLSDADRDGVAESRRILSEGYGVRTGWYGHDLHGLTWGPDGRLYFSMADRGFDVTSQEGRVYHGPNTGGVFRCWPDGSGLELVAQGLRNPQELAFDDLGYLFTGDNNCDAGDKARLVYLVEGGDSGWRVSVQSLADRGPWLSEAMWEMPREEEALQPAWILPPIAHINSGPSGMAHYPGTGLPAEYEDYFFLCDYRGGRGSIQAFRVEPEGARFVMRGHHSFHDGPTVSDVCFSYDGKVVASEWGAGWDISPQAKIYTLTHKPSQQSADVRAVSSWFYQGFSQFSNERLTELLGYADQRVRYEAQRQLVVRSGREDFARVLAEADERLARLHAVWGLGQLARQDRGVLEALLPYLTDSDPEVHGRVLQVCAEYGFSEAGNAAVEALGAVNHPRLRFHAAYAVGKLRPDGALKALVQLLQSNHDEDPYLRHAAVMGLVALQRDDELLALATESQSESVRLATVLVLRRRDDSRVGQFLADPSFVIAVEAARAIYDQEMARGREPLASSLERAIEGDGVPVAMVRRALHANFQLGSEEAAERICRFALSSVSALETRIEALELLLSWDAPPNREGIWGRWRPLSRAVAGLAMKPVRTYLQDFLEIQEEAMQGLAQRLDAAYGREKTASQLASMVGDPLLTEASRVQALVALEKVRASDLALFEKVCQEAIHAPDAEMVRAAAVQSWVRVRGDDASEVIRRAVVDESSVLVKQAGVRSASALSAPRRREFLMEWLERLSEGVLDPDIQLDVFELAETSKDTDIAERVEIYREKVGSGGIHKLSMFGGNATAGALIYESNLAAQCMRCHSLKGRGGDVGPNLDGIGSRREPSHILQSVVDPQSEIAFGYGMQTVTLTTGDIVVGTLVAQDDDSVSIRENGQLKKIARTDIRQFSEVVSGMPPAGLVLQPRELRDLMAFLQGLK